MPNFNFTDEGSGQPLVFIHGYCESLRIWSEFVKPFAKEYRVICVDLPGFGKSGLPDGEFSIADIAHVVWELLTSLDVKTCFVVGHSLGGYVTLEMAGQQPDRVAGFCMFHSTAYADDETKKINRTKVMEFVAKNGTPAFVQTLIPSLFAIPNHTKIESLLEEARQINPATVIDYARAMRDRADRTKVYDTFSKPVLFFVGMKDRVISADSILKQTETLQNKIVHQLADVGHMGMLEAPTQTQSLLMNFLRDKI